MTIKLVLLKSGEDIISDISEMVSGVEENRRVVGYFLKKPCVVKIRDSEIVGREENSKQSSFRISLIPWIPLSADQVIPVPADWVVTMVEPKDKLKDMYVEEVLDAQNYKSDSSDDETDSD